MIDKVTAATLKEFGRTIFPPLINFLTKSTRDSTPQDERIDKCNTRMCLGGHRCIVGRDFCGLDAYVPVPTWGHVKLQLAMAAIHGPKLQAFDCTAAYLQTHIEKESYVRPSLWPHFITSCACRISPASLVQIWTNRDGLLQNNLG